MSKAVKKVGKVISKVVKGVQKLTMSVVKGTQSFVKKIAKSKIGKIILVAAAVYFTGGAILGAMGGASAAAGTGFLGTLSGAVSGAGAGISSAWSGLTGAASAAMGGNFAAAGSSLSGGLTGAYGAGSGAVTAANLAAAGGALPATPGAYFSSGTAGQTAANTAVKTAAKTAATSPGIISSAWNGLGDLGKMAAVQGTTQLVGGAMQGIGAQKEAERQEQLAQDARNRYNQNVGTNLWGEQPEGGSNYEPRTGEDGRYQALQYQTAPELAMLRRRGGIVNANMQRQNPTFGMSQFPVYNPESYNT